MSEKSTTIIRISAVVSVVVSFIRSHPLHVSYFVLLFPHILKILSLLSLVTVLAALCLFSVFSSLLLRLIKINESDNPVLTNVTDSPKSEDCKIIYETHQDPLKKTAQEKSFAGIDLSKNAVADGLVENLVGSSLADQVEIELSVPEIVKDCCSFTPSSLPEPESAQEYDEIEAVFYSATTDFSEGEIIKHMVCTVIKPTQNPDQSVSEFTQAASLEIEKVGSKKSEPLIPTTTRRQTESEVEIDNVPIKRGIFNSSSSYLSSYGSMRVEREWTRTLACKLFEERHSSSGRRGGDDAMDMLWETYEDTESTGTAESTQSTPRSTVLSRKSSKAKLTTERKKSDAASRNSDVEDEDDEASGRRLCCLQALKMSSGKVNLGIGRKNMVRVSKALRGLGWFHKTNITSSSTKNLK